MRGYLISWGAELGQLCVPAVSLQELSNCVQQDILAFFGVMLA